MVSDRLHPEVISRGGRRLVGAHYTIMKTAWENVEIPADCKDDQLVTTFKKRDERDYDNYRIISQLSSIYPILPNRLMTLKEDSLPEAQCRFRGTTEKMLQQIQEKFIEQNMPFYMIFVHFTKVFDSLNKESLWNIQQKLGYLDQFGWLVSALHTGMKASVNLRG